MKRVVGTMLMLGMIAALFGFGAGSAGSHASSTTSTNGSLHKVMVRLLDASGNPSEPVAVDRLIRTDEQWRQQLTREQYEVARGKGTERAFCGVFYDHKKPGHYTCVCCELPLFSSDAKFDSGTGWPSFFKPYALENVKSQKDLSHGMVRTEILCARCDAHLGHVFEDGPPPTGLRYCLNSASLKFHERKE